MGTEIQLYISIGGLCFFYFSNAHTLSAVLGIELMSKDAIAVRRRHVIELAMSAIARSPSMPGYMREATRA
jgi:TetR/AcrR family transcriptional regulator